MKRKKLAVIIFAVCGAFSVAAQQTKTHDFSLGAGYIQTMNSSTLPSGLSGTNTSFDYLYLRSSTMDTYRGVSIKGQYAFLQLPIASGWIKEWLPTFRQAELQASGVWLKQLPVEINNLKLYAGTGLSLDAVLHYVEQPVQKYLPFYSNAELNWYLSPDLLLKADYVIKKSCFRASFSLPVAFVGNFSTQFHYAAFDRMKYAKNKIIPNTFTLAHRIFQPVASLSYLYPVFSTTNTAWQLQVKYVYEGLDLNLKSLTERKEQHDFRMGFVCTM